MNIEKTEEIKAYLARSDEALRAARSLKKEGYLRDAASRAYYSMFYAATAALISVDVHRSKHSGVIAEFARHFVKTRKVSETLSDKLRDAFDYRDVADYAIDEEITPKIVNGMLVDAETFLKEVKRCLFEEKPQ